MNCIPLLHYPWACCYMQCHVIYCLLCYTVSCLCLPCYRKHDLRLSLNSYNAVSHDDPTVERFVKTVHLSEDGELAFVPQAHDKEWTARIIRHKVIHAYHNSKKNYIATVSKINTYEIAPDDLQPQPLKQGEFTIGGNDWKEHYEIEVKVYKTSYVGYTGNACS